jgi:hypothetical protein
VLAILFILLLSLVPAYSFNKFLQKIIKPRESFGRIFLYLFSGLLFVFIYTFLLVFIIGKLFPGA